MDKILHCDCVEGMKKLPADLIDLTVTSPPYDGLRTFNGNLLPMDKFKQVADGLLRITRPGGVVVPARTIRAGSGSFP
jgi:site-specific DNA-methyltransferase (adenine-specific)